MYTPPVTSLTMSVLGPLNRPSLFDIRLNDATGALFGPTGTVFDGWCLAMNIFLDVNTASTGTVYSGYEFGTLSAAGLPIGSGVGALNNLDSINWLINEYNGSNYTWGEVQAAIWSLIGDDWTMFSQALGNPDPARVSALSGQALANDGFKPHAGQILGLVLDVRDGSGNQQQPTLIEVRAAEVGDRVFEDKDANGIQDAGDLGIAGARIELVRDINGDGDFDDANEVLAAGTTDASGDYSFKGLTPGADYQVRFVQPAGYNGGSPRQVGGDVSLDSDGLVSDVQRLAPGEYRSTVDSGFYKFAALGDRVWLDANSNGQQDFGEGGQSGVTVNLLNSAGTVIATQITGSGGSYLFSNLVPGNYSVEFIAPTGLSFTSANTGSDVTDSDASQANGRTGTYTLLSGETNRTADAGLVQQVQQVGSLSGKVLEDGDNNGTGDTPIGGVTVALKNSAGVVVGTTTTAADGSYSFSNLPAGTYTVEQTNLVGYNDVGDKDGGNPNSILATVPAGGQSTGNDFIDDRPATLGDRVWLDQDGDGQQEAGDLNVAGVVVNLLNAAGNVVSTQTTNSNGNYLFTNLDAGTYSVQFVKPAGYDFTVANNGADGTDSDANQISGNTGTYTLASGDDNRTVDAGLKVPAPLPGSVSGTVLEDRDNNGTGDSPIAGVVVVLKNPAGVVVGQTTTDANGNYSFSNVPAGNYMVEQTNLPGYNDVGDKDGGNPNSIAVTVTAGGSSPGNNFIDDRPATLGDRVWLDQDGDGQQEAGDLNVSGVVVNLLSAAGNVVSTQTTNANGNYLFTNLDAGTYSVQFIKPVGYNFTVANNGVDGTDSDANQLTGNTGTYTLASGDDNRTVDAGLVQPAPPAKGSIGDRVWEDKNYNGVQDSGEVGVSGVTVKLLNSAGVVVATTTNATGNYLFSNLDAGNYKVQVLSPSGYFVTKLDQGGNDANDSDINSSGITGTIALAAGQAITNVDAGIYRKASIGDKVFADWNHNGLQDTGEGMVKHVKVLLQDSNGNTIATTTTDKYGAYKFTDLNPGTYRIGFDKSDGVHVADGASVKNWQWAKLDVGADDSRDSDATGVYNGIGYTAYTTLESGEVDNTWDVGVTPIVIDLDGNGIQTIARSDAGGTFDLFGTGVAVASGWISGGDGFLAVDVDGNGIINSSAELFGGTGKGAGFAKLGAYDSNGDGMVSMLDADFANLLVWQDANGNHQTDAGELMTLAQAGVSSLSLSLADQNFYADTQGNVHGETSSATLANGESVTMTDVYFSVDKSDAMAAGAALPTIGELLGTGESELDALMGACAAGFASAQSVEDSCAEAGELLRKLAALSLADMEQQASLAA